MFRMRERANVRQYFLEDRTPSGVYCGTLKYCTASGTDFTSNVIQIQLQSNGKIKKPHASAVGLSGKVTTFIWIIYAVGAHTSADGFSSSSPIALQTTSAMSSEFIFSSFSLALMPSVNMVRQNGHATAMLVAFTSIA